MNKVSLVIYTKPGCPYCQQARDYYNSKGIGFIDRDAQTNREYRAEMFKYSGDDPTVPCIVEDGKYLQSGWGDPLRGWTVHDWRAVARRNKKSFRGGLKPAVFKTKPGRAVARL